MEGWIKLHRRLTKHWIWTNEKYLKCWIWFLIRANHKTEKVLIDTELIELKPGEFITSIHKIAEATKLTTQNVRTILKLLQSDKMINKASNTRLTKITICNYDDYQVTQQTYNKPTNKLATYGQQSANKQPTTDKNVKNEKNEKENLYKGDSENLKNDYYQAQLNDLCQWFEISEQNNFNSYRDIVNFLTTITHRSKLKYFAGQFDFYKKYKTASNQQIHGIPNFIGDNTNNNFYENGAWNAENWQKRYNDYNKKANPEDKKQTYKRNQIHYD